MHLWPDEETPSAEEQVREWSVAVNQAVTLSKQAGKTPAGLARTLEGAAEAAVDWRELLRRLWSDTIPADSSWMRPTGATSGTDSICLESCARASERLPSLSIAPAQ